MSAALKPKPITIETLIQGAATLTHAELRELKDAIEGLMDAQVVDLDAEREKRREPEPMAIGPTTEKKKAQGWYEVGMKTINGKQYGPYKYLRYRSGGKKKSVYLGRVAK
jgi:hypothetical protein